MNIDEILKEILEALADGKQPNETTSQYRDRKAAELQKHFADKKAKAEADEKKYEKLAKDAKSKYEKNPNETTVDRWSKMQDKALDACFKGGEASTKGWNVKRIKDRIDWKKYMNNSEALELLETLLNERNMENKAKKNEAVKKVGQEVIDDYEQEGRSLAPYGDDAKQWGRDKMSGDRDILGVKRVIPKLADKLQFGATAELDRKLNKRPCGDSEGRKKILNGFYINAVRKANKDSVKEAFELMEEIINEVSSGKWKEAAANSIEGRKQKFNDEVAKIDKVWAEYEKEARKHPENKEELKKEATEKEGDVRRADARLGHAIEVADEVPNSKFPATKYANVKINAHLHPKKVNEALDIMEEIINEVSVKRWKEAAANSIDRRKEAADNTSKAAQQSWDDYEEYSRKHPEEEDALYRRAWRNDIIAKKAEDKADHASDVLHVKANAKSANKAIKAAKNVEDKREAEYLQNDKPEQFNRLRKRMMKVDQLVSADPVKSRNEGLEESLHDQLEKKRIEAEHTPLANHDEYVKKYKEYAKLDKAYKDAHGKELEQAIEREGGGNFTSRGSWNVQHKRGTDKNELGEIKTRQRRVNSKQIKKSIFRHNTKDAGKPSEPTVKDDYRHKTMLGYSDPYGFGTKHGKDAKVKASIERHNRKVKKMNEAFEIMEEILNVLAEDIHSAIDKSNKGSKYTEQGTAKSDLHYLAGRGQRMAEIQYAKEKGKPVGKQWEDEAEYSQRQRGDDTKNAKGMRKTQAKQFKGFGRISVYGNEPEEHEKEVRRESAKKAGRPVKEALELMEEILFELDTEQKQNISPNKIRKNKKDENGEKVEVVSVADELFPYEGDAKQQFNQKILAKINDMIGGVGSLEDLIQFVRKGVQAKKAAHESIQEGKPKDPKGYKENMDIANHYDNLYSKEPAKAPDGSPNSVAAEWNRRYQHYFDKAMKCYYGEKSKKVAEALEEMKQVIEGLFVNDGRKDLLDDIDTGLGSPVKKAFNQATGQKAPKAPVKEPVEIKNKQVSMKTKKDPSIMPKPTVKNVYKQAENR